MINKVSIIIPSYNHSNFLEDRINSIINQTYTNWELIIIDDNSDDDSVSKLKLLLKNYNHKIKHFIVNKENSGSGYTSWKYGIELADTDYIWIAETDDYSENTFLEESIKVLIKDKEIALVFSSSSYVDENKKFMYDSLNRTKDLSVKYGDNKTFDSSRFLLATCSNPYIINGSSVVFKNPKEKKIPNHIFNKGLSTDIFLWTFLVLNNKFGFINNKLNFFRRHANSTTSIINTHKLKQVYVERINFLNFFGLSNYYKPLLNSYISNYVWSNKKDIFNSKFLNKLEKKKFVQLNYYKFLISYGLKKINKKIFNG